MFLPSPMAIETSLYALRISLPYGEKDYLAIQDVLECPWWHRL
jgi:hypothetical protein